MAKVLFVHNGTPGRFAFLGRLLRARGDECVLLNPPEGNEIEGVPTVRWRASQGSTKGIFGPATKAEADLIRGVAALESARSIRENGFTPDLIVGHPGWGEMALLHEVFPEARQIQVGEYYYRARGGDVDFDPEFASREYRTGVAVAAKNAVLAMSMAEADRIVCPTPFQASVLPASLRSRAVIIHEGIDTELAHRRDGVRIRLPGDRVVDETSEVVTFVNRSFEPMRGVHVFMRALPRLLAARPEAQVLMIGADGPPAYGAAPAQGGTWKAAMLAELEGRLDLGRVHFLGKLTYEQLLSAFSISAAHVYLTYPFVLSWSLLDAMACECLLVASDTAPVRDVITPGVDGLTVDFFDVDGLADTVARACADRGAYVSLRKAARAKVVAEYDRRTVTEPAWMALVDDLLARPRGG